MLIAYQGAPGAYSQIAARSHSPGCRTAGFGDFEGAVASVGKGEAELALIPVRNSIVGTVPGALEAITGRADVEVVDHVEQRVAHCLLALPGADLDSLKWVESHPMALAQCSRWLSARRIRLRHVDDTAGAARAIAQDRDWTRAAVADESAAERHGLVVLARDIADAPDNATTFAVLRRRSALAGVAA